jgi:hypothetical protein
MLALVLVAGACTALWSSGLGVTSSLDIKLVVVHMLAWQCDGNVV